MCDAGPLVVCVFIDHLPTKTDYSVLNLLQVQIIIGCISNNFRLIWVDSGRITSMKLDGTELKILPVSARIPELVVVYKVTHSYQYVGIIFDKTY